MKKGDKIRCVDASPLGCPLMHGLTYSVESYHPAPHGLGEWEDGTGAVQLVEVRGVFRETRFEPA